MHHRGHRQARLPRASRRARYAATRRRALSRPRALAPARSRARALARAHVCTTLKLSTTRSVKFTVKSITHVVELTQSTLRKRKLDNNTVKLTSRQVDGPSDSQLDSVIRYSELDGRQLDYETRQLLCVHGASPPPPLVPPRWLIVGRRRAELPPTLAELDDATLPAL